MNRKYFLALSVGIFALSLVAGNFSLKYLDKKPINAAVKQEMVELMHNKSAYELAQNHCAKQRNPLSARCKAVVLVNEHHAQAMSLKVNKRIAAYVMN